MVKFHKTSLGDIKEFFDISQDDLRSQNEPTDIPIFNVPKKVPLNFISPQSEENFPLRDKKADKQDDLTQILFDYMVE